MRIKFACLPNRADVGVPSDSLAKGPGTFIDQSPVWVEKGVDGTWLAKAVDGVGVSLWSPSSCPLQLLLLWFVLEKEEVVSLGVLMS